MTHYPKETKQLDLQFTSTKKPYQCLLDGWKLKEESPGFALVEKGPAKAGAKDYGDKQGVDKYVAMAEVGPCKLDPSLKALCFQFTLLSIQTLKLRVRTLLST